MKKRIYTRLYVVNMWHKSIYGVSNMTYLIPSIQIFYHNNKEEGRRRTEISLRFLNLKLSANFTNYKMI